MHVPMNVEFVGSFYLNVRQPHLLKHRI